MSLDTVLDVLRCPRCASHLYRRGAAVVCPRGHSYDIARQGYLNLLAGPPPRHADTTAMVAARDRFLATGSYAPLVGGLLAAVGDLQRPTVLDAGAGTGYYLTEVLNATGGRGLALDIAVAAARRAARAHAQLGAVAADVWAPLPLADEVFDAVLSVFAPRNPAEFARVLRPGGRLVVLTPTPAHLTELRTALDLLAVEADKPARLAAALADGFAADERQHVHAVLELDRATAQDLVQMGPNAFHHTADAVADQLAGRAFPWPVTVSAEITTWRRR